MSSMETFFIAPSKLKGITPRLAISLEALDKEGKTDWALRTCPDPVAIVSNDPGTEWVLQKLRAEFPNRKYPFILSQNFEKPDPKIIKKEHVDSRMKALWEAEWKRFDDAMYALAEDTTVKTLVIDTASELAQLGELSFFGKLKGNAQINLRTEYNRAMSSWFWRLYKGRPELNIILIHRLKKFYVPNSKGDSEWNGSYEREGFNRAGFLVDMAIRTGWDSLKKDFYTEVAPGKATRFGTELIGQRWYSRDGENGFGWLGMSVFKETENTPEWWGIEL